MRTYDSESYPKHPITPHTKWFAFIQDPDATTVFSAFMTEQHQEYLCLTPTSLPLLFHWLESGISPFFVFLDLSAMDYPYPELQQLIEKAPCSTNIIAFGTKNDPEHYHQVKKLGINEYLSLPISEEQLMRTCFDSLIKKTHKGQKRKILIPVIGARGDSGATTLAINAAYYWSQLPNQRVCLLDLDTQASDMALQLNINQQSSLAEALSEPERVDEHFINSLLVEKKPNLFAITNNWSLSNPFNPLQLSSEALQHFLLLLYEKVDSVFVDLSFPLNTHLMKLLLPHTRSCLLVTHCSLGAVRDTVQLMQWIKTLGLDLDLKIIVNSSRPTEHLELIKSSMAKNIGKAPDLILPYSKTELQEAVLNGNVFVEYVKNSAFAKALASFMQGLALEQQVINPEKKSLLDKLKEWL